MKWLALFLMILVLQACSQEVKIVEVNEPPVITAGQFEMIDTELPVVLTGIFSDGTERPVDITWEDSLDAIDTRAYGTYTIEGHVDDAVTGITSFPVTQTVEVTPKPAYEALGLMDDHTHYHSLFLESDDAFKDAGSHFIFTDDAFEAMLALLDMDKEAFMASDAYPPFMKSHALGESLPEDRLFSDVPALYETLSSETLLIEGVSGEPRIMGRHVPVESYRVENGHLHVIDGVILSDTVLEILGSDAINEGVTTRFTALFSELGIMRDILRGEHFTVFVPSERAILDFAETMDMSINELLAWEGIDDVLLSHIVRGEYSAETLFTGAPLTLETLGGPINATVEDDALLVGGAQLVSSESFGSFATLHSISQVIYEEESE